jgi:two-component system chemotaxis response regulator CheY
MQIMMITTESEADNVMAALEAGANEYLMKPFNKESIQDKLSILGLVP